MKKLFVPTRLYIKRIGNLRYFGKTSNLNVENYPGSGKIWRDKIKKYGKSSIITEWISDWYYDADEIREVAISFSIENDIIDSENWANLKIENGIDGGPCAHTVESRSKISRGGKGRICSEITKRKIANGKLGKNHPLFTGHYVTPWGVFESSYEAKRMLDQDSEYSTLAQRTIHQYCKANCDKRFGKNGNLPINRWYKTPRELGFGFIPANN